MGDLLARIFGFLERLIPPEMLNDELRTAIIFVTVNQVLRVGRASPAYVGELQAALAGSRRGVH